MVRIPNMKRINCCEFKAIEAIKDTSDFSKSIYRECRELIILDKDLWVRNNVAFVQYSVCGSCKLRIKRHFHSKLSKYGLKGAQNGILAAVVLNSIEGKIKPWYPKFIVRRMILRAMKEDSK